MFSILLLSAYEFSQAGESDDGSKKAGQSISGEKFNEVKEQISQMVEKGEKWMQSKGKTLTNTIKWIKEVSDEDPLSEQSGVEGFAMFYFVLFMSVMGKS